MSKASRRLRREAASAKPSRAIDLSIFAISVSFLAPIAVAQEQDASNTAENQTATKKSDEDMTEILVTGIRKALETPEENLADAEDIYRRHSQRVVFKLTPAALPEGLDQALDEQGYAKEGPGNPLPRARSIPPTALSRTARGRAAVP